MRSFAIFRTCLTVILAVSQFRILGRCVAADTNNPRNDPSPTIRSPSWATPASYTLSLSGSQNPPQSHRYLRFTGTSLNPNYQFQQPITAINLGRTWNTQVSWGGQVLNLVFDTGSSDTWVVDERFECLDPSGRRQPTGRCAFGRFYNRSRSFTEIPDVKFQIRYGDGEWATGVFGYENISLAGLVAKCQVAVVERAYWLGDHISSGLLGFGLRGLTSQTDRNGSISTYHPVFARLSQANKIDPIFSVALGRTMKESEDSGLLALGGLPDVSIAGPWVSLPLQSVSFNRNQGKEQDQNQYTFYSVQIEDVGVGYSPELLKRDEIWSNQSFQWFSTSPELTLTPTPTTNPDTARLLARDADSVRMSAIVDTGTTLNFFNRQVADFINQNACSLPGEFAPILGVYLIPCTAVCRPLAIRMGDQILVVDARDLMLNQGPLCYLGVSVTESLNILGGTFLKNVVVVFDPSAAEIRFAQRSMY